MYGVGPSVANVTANGEEIVSVTEVGLCRKCIYLYDNNKMVTVSVADCKVSDIAICITGIHNDSRYPIWGCNYNRLNEEEKNEFFPVAEMELVTQDAIRRYETDHRKSRGKACSLL